MLGDGIKISGLKFSVRNLESCRKSLSEASKRKRGDKLFLIILFQRLTKSESNFVLRSLQVSWLFVVIVVKSLPTARVMAKINFFVVIMVNYSFLSQDTLSQHGRVGCQNWHTVANAYSAAGGEHDQHNGE